jgi:transcription elongation factor GreA
LPSLDPLRLAMSDLVPMTRAGYDKLKAELAQMETVEMPKLAQRVAAARSEGDLSENAEYHGARESQGMLQAKINLLRDKLARASIVDTSRLPKDEVAFGATVVVKDLDFGDEENFTLVGAGEEDYDTGKILVTSPLAQGLLGKKIGDKVEIPVPAGKMRFQIVEIKFE